MSQVPVHFKPFVLQSSLFCQMHCLSIVVLVCCDVICLSLYILGVPSSSGLSLCCIFSMPKHHPKCEFLLPLQYLTGIICILEDPCQQFFSPFYPGKK